MSLTAEGDSRETPMFSPASAQERIRPSSVTHAAPGLRARTRTGDGDTGPARRLAASSRSIRRHWMLTILLTAGLALPVVTPLAYPPALLYIDSPKYLVAGLEKLDPEGYLVLLLKPVLAAGDLA